MQLCGCLIYFYHTPLKLQVTIGTSFDNFDPPHTHPYPHTLTPPTTPHTHTHILTPHILTPTHHSHTLTPQHHPPHTTHAGVATVNIVVQDFNDCPPVFVNLPPSGSVSIAEGVSKGTVLETFQVSDCDSGDNGVNGTRFTIIAGENM